MTDSIKDLVYIKESNQLIQIEVSDSAYDLKISTITESSVIDNDTPQIEGGKHQLPSFLSENKVYIIDSVNSGTGRSDQKNLYSKLIKPLFDSILHINHAYIATTSPSSVIEFAHDLKSKSNDPITVIFISGDTSVNEFINALPSIESSSKITVFPFPSGTGNSLSLSIGLTDEITALQRLITTTTQSPLNLYEVEFPKGTSYLVRDEKTVEITQPLNFLVVLSWAFHASLVADSDTPELRKFGLERFKKAAFANLEQEQKYDGEFIINDKEVVEGPFAYWLITASKRFEPTFEISPKGDIIEDSLYLVSFKTETDPSYIMDIMGQVYNQGSHINDPRVTYRKLEKNDKLVLKASNLISKRKKRFCLDGSIIELPDQSTSELSFKVKDNTYNNWHIYIVN
ncbi:ATP-NAD kinase-like domain-containing protein [Scheffersomyces coipomensis]|uniref:ATP-NAD kinase-like domain-containing protein n=1 Tax=Scheffersomyces coipomensis TaxID=1788519 RepID=UPI00315DC37F